MFIYQRPRCNIFRLVQSWTKIELKQLIRALTVKTYESSQIALFSFENCSLYKITKRNCRVYSYQRMRNYLSVCVTSDFPLSSAGTNCFDAGVYREKFACLSGVFSPKSKLFCKFVNDRTDCCCRFMK